MKRKGAGYFNGSVWTLPLWSLDVFFAASCPPRVFFLSSHGGTCPLLHSQLSADPLGIRFNAGAFPHVTPPPLPGGKPAPSRG